MNNTFTTATNTITDQSTQNLDRTISGLKDGMAQATAGVEQTQAKMRDGVERAMNAAQEMFSFGQGNLEAFARSGQIFATGLQALTRSMATTAKATMDETISAMKALSSVKSLKEAADLQQHLARTAMEKAVSQSSAFTDGTMKLTEQAFAPIGARMTLAAEKFSKTA